jgi:hypothetical protein
MRSRTLLHFLELFLVEISERSSISLLFVRLARAREIIFKVRVYPALHMLTCHRILFDDPDIMAFKRRPLQMRSIKC